MTLKRGIAPKTVRGRSSSPTGQETKVALLARERDELARGLAEELWKDCQPAEPDMTAFVRNAEGIVIYSAAR